MTRYACEKFRQYILGKQVTVEPDHKPLEMIFRKEIHLTSLRLKIMLPRHQQHNISIEYHQGKQMRITDALSHATVDPGNQLLDDG